MRKFIFLLLCLSVGCMSEEQKSLDGNGYCEPGVGFMVNVNDSAPLFDINDLYIAYNLYGVAPEVTESPAQPFRR